MQLSNLSLAISRLSSAGAGAATFNVLNSLNGSYLTSTTVLNSVGISYVVSKTVLDSFGIAYVVA